MPRFKKGETSYEVLDKKKAVTRSILTKSKIIDKINTYEDIAPSLEIKSNEISQAAVHKWNDDQLGIISYSRNTAHAAHNSHTLNILIASINNANGRLANPTSIDDGTRRQPARTSRLSEAAVTDLKNENADLLVALAEVYRAYMQLLDNYREDKEVDEALRKLIKDQARVLGENRVWRIK
tara:strand:- start:5851 stop:6393 length:543 start_codon:yes stop_codon:yes gene_type:complete